MEVKCAKTIGDLMDMPYTPTASALQSDVGEKSGLVCPEHLVAEDLRKQVIARENPIDRPAAELLAWTLERHLETILGIAVELAHHDANNAKSHMRLHAHQHAWWDPPSGAHQSAPTGVLCAVFGKDIELARRLLGERS